MRDRYADQPKADDQHIERQKEIRGFSKQRALIVNVGFLVLRPPEWYITTPLVSYQPFAHCATDHTQHPRVEEKFWREARRLKGHRHKMAMRSTVGFFTMALQITEENRPEGLAASLNQQRRQMRPQYAKAFSLQFGDFFVGNHPPGPSPPKEPVWQRMGERVQKTNGFRSEEHTS